MNSTEKLIFIILAVSFLVASAYILGAGPAGVIALGGDNQIVKVVPVILRSEPGMPVASSGLASPYGTYPERGYDFRANQYGNLNSICTVPTYYSRERYFASHADYRVTRSVLRSTRYVYIVTARHPGESRGWRV